MKKENKDVNVEDVYKHQDSISEEHQVRLEKVTTMRQSGIEPWPQHKPVNATCKDVIDEYQEDKESRQYEIAGRVMSFRSHGKTIFATIQDQSGRLQIYVRRDEIGDKPFEQFKDFVDVGDIIWCSGKSFKTKMGEITLKVGSYVLLSKSLHPLPEKFHGLVDIETKYRQRYLDLISNEESRERFKTRSKIISTMRQFLDAHYFIEVETPMLHPIPGGAVARPFVTHHNALDMTLYLRIAPELYLKRLVVGGFERVYEINRCFRNEGISTKHNPEFTTVEFYVAHKDYYWVMEFVENMTRRIVQDVSDTMHVQYGDYVLDFEKPFERITMYDAIIKYGNCSAQDLEQHAIDKTLKKHGITFDKKDASWGEKLYALFDELVESKLIQPTFITQFPVEVSPLAKRNTENPDFVDRFELFIAGMELSNAFNELNDPFDQAERFKQQVTARERGDQEAHYYDEDYIMALEYALPPTVGFGMGIDRLTMLLTNAISIKDVILFPTLKQKKA